MKKIIYSLTCITFLFYAYNSKAQAPGIDWVITYTAYIGYGTCAEPTADSGYIVGGSFASHFLVYKLDASGTKKWSRWIYSGTGVTTVNAVKQTTDKGYIVAGSDFATSADSIGNHGIRDFMITKMDSTGHAKWIKCLGGTSNEEAQSIEQTADGGYIVAGYTFSNDGNVSGVHWYADYWVVKLDTGGNITWQKCLGGNNYDYATSVVQTSDGGYIVCGYSGSKDGDVTGTHWGGSDDDVWVVKLDASGTITWQRSYGGSKEDHAYSIRQTGDGGYIVAGSTVSSDGNVSGKHGVSYDNQDYWVIKLDATGTLTWQKCLGGSGSGVGAGSGNDIAYAVRQTTDGGYVIAGTVSSGTATNDDITGYHGTTGSDYWAVKLDATSNITWQKSLGGSGTEDARTIAQTLDGGYVIAGTTVNSPDGDVSTSDYGSNHPWVVKLLNGAVGIRELSGDAGFEMYPNPATSQITVKSNLDGTILKVMDMTGKLIYSSVMQGNMEIIDTDRFPNGMYTVQAISNTKVVTKKLLLQQ